MRAAWDQAELDLAALLDSPQLDHAAALEHPAPEPEEGRPEAHLEGPEPVAVPDEHEWRPPDHDEPPVTV